MANLIINELKTTEEILSAYPTMKQLRTHLSEETYLELVCEAIEKDCYRLLSLQDGEEILAVVGFKPMITLYYGRFVWVCDLVTEKTKRYNGYGEMLLTHVHVWAKENGYESVALSSGLQRTNTHRFYEEKMEYEKVSFVFKKSLK